MLISTHDTMHHNIALIFQRWLIVACIGCVLGTGTAAADSDQDGLAAYSKGDYAQASRILRPLAAQGDASAQYFLGLMHERGEGVTKNLQEALKWYRLAAAQGNDKAQFILGRMCLNGKGVPKDYQEALKWYRLAAAQGNDGAQYSLGWMYENGKGITRDYREAVKWFRLAAAQGNDRARKTLERPEMVAAAQNLATTQVQSQQPQHSASNRTSTFDNGKKAYDKGDYAQAIKTWEPLATQGHAGAQNNLGVIYVMGKGVIRDDQEALKWFRLAAAQGDVNAQYSLGAMYRMGYGITQDAQEALKWFRLAAAQGSESAKEILKHPEMVEAAQNLAPMQAQPQQLQQSQQSQQPQPLVSNRTETKAGWVYVGDDETVTAYSAPATRRKAGNKVTMWDLADFKMVQELFGLGGKSYMSVRQQNEYNCKENKSRSLHSTAHSGNMGEGEIIGRLNKPGDWESVPPNSRIELLWKFACEN